MTSRDGPKANDSNHLSQAVILAPIARISRPNLLRNARILRSDGAHVLGSRTFGAVPLDVGHSLIFVQRIERRGLDARHMEEKVIPLAGPDEAKPSVRQPLNRSFSH
jgi:hypothetical protein